MRVAAFAEWSFGRDMRLTQALGDMMAAEYSIRPHRLKSDVDLNRTVCAFSGPAPAVFAILELMTEMVFPTIDLQHHTGLHPRIGALDVCDLCVSPDDETGQIELEADIERYALFAVRRWSIPVVLTERSERTRPEQEILEMRRGGFGSLLERRLRSDYGPNQVHPLLGVLMIGQRPYNLRIEVQVESEATVCQELAEQLSSDNLNETAPFPGVAATTFFLPTLGRSILRLDLRLPDFVGVDELMDWIHHWLHQRGGGVKGAQWEGFVRSRDLEFARSVTTHEEQVLDGAMGDHAF